MHFISLEERKTANSDIYARYAIGSLFLEKADWRSKKDPIVPVVESRCIFTCEVIRLSVSGVQIIQNAELFIS
jgi:hypothetical protein